MDILVNFRFLSFSFPTLFPKVCQLTNAKKHMDIAVQIIPISQESQTSNTIAMQFPFHIISSNIHYIIQLACIPYSNLSPIDSNHLPHNPQPNAHHHPRIGSPSNFRTCCPSNRRRLPSHKACPKRIAIRRHDPITCHIIQATTDACRARRTQILRCRRYRNASSRGNDRDCETAAFEFCRASCVVGLAVGIGGHASLGVHIRGRDVWEGEIGICDHRGGAGNCCC
jgi:hypothetical protein